MMDYTIDLISLKDLDGVFEIEKSTFQTPWSWESLANELTNPLARYYVVHVNGEVVGYAGAWLAIDEAHVTNVAIREDMRGNGLGCALMQKLIQLCADSGMKTMFLEVRRGNTVAQNLYKKLGFVVDGFRKGYYEGKEDAVLMSKKDMPEGNPENDPFLIYEP